MFAPKGNIKRDSKRRNAKAKSEQHARNVEERRQLHQEKAHAGFGKRDAVQSRIDRIK